jgi:nucleotide-binding universal stress UspA family protein
MPLINRILVPTDFSETASRALEYGAELAARFGVPLLLLHVYANPVVPVPDGFVVMPAVDLAAMMNQLEKGLGDVRLRAQALGVRQVDTVMVEGTAWSEISRVAKDRNCDLIVLGTHGRGGLAHLLLGSVAEKVVRNAECPVLTVSLKAKV